MGIVDAIEGDSSQPTFEAMDLVNDLVRGQVGSLADRLSSVGEKLSTGAIDYESQDELAEAGIRTVEL